MYVCIFVFRAAPMAYGDCQASGVQSELQLLVTPQPQQCRIQTTSVSYTTAHGNARSLTHWVRPGIKPATSWFLVDSFPLCHDGNSYKLWLKVYFVWYKYCYFLFDFHLHGMSFSIISGIFSNHNYTKIEIIL